MPLLQPLRKPPPPLGGDLTGKTILITGANTGLGYEAAVHLAKLRPERLIITSRNKAKGDVALSQIAESTGYSAELRLVDLADFRSVKSFLDGVESDGVKIDILVLNAGINNFDYERTNDGYETSLQVNCISQAWMALRLVTCLQNARQAHDDVRLIVVGSAIHATTDLGKAKSSPKILDTMNDQGYCTPSVMKMRYRDTKLIDMFFVRALASRLDPSSILVTTLSPGLCATQLRRNLKGVYSYLDSAFSSAFAYTAEEGSRQILYSALAGQGDVSTRRRLHGTSSSLHQVDETYKFVLSRQRQEIEEKIWGELVEILSKHDTLISEIIKNNLAAPNDLI